MQPLQASLLSSEHIQCQEMTPCALAYWSKFAVQNSSSEYQDLLNIQLGAAAALDAAVLDNMNANPASHCIWTACAYLEIFQCAFSLSDEA